ncbi:alpha/beta hydrolase [Umezawaea tangerina]|uniref:Alpha/beta hydrolase family protein n=1 Tax=Umezawaea tangerina TaxID=84725 RepID=A0A2T0T4G4_9PSEU|nr:alpha/beta hydrolase [Umezawaea tangerina]PRY40566.1 alpha/beta hydrolase family protein [Umezawaea tangerina]
MRPILRVLGAVLTSAAMLTGTAVADADVSWNAPGIDWSPCPDAPAADCGTVRVPLDWAEPHGPSVDLAVSRLKASDPARRIGVLFGDPGGPGGSAAAFAQSGSYFSAEVRARFDVIGFDQRGTGGSSVIRCSPEVLAKAPSPYPADQAAFDALLRYNAELRTDCRAQGGPLFDHANTADAARDMDFVRRALRERRISFAGISYGTLLGEQYAELFGEHLRAMVLDSVIDHSADTTRFVVDRAASVEASFGEFVKWCDRDAACVLHGRDVVALWEDALRGADASGFGRENLLGYVHGLLYEPAWGEIASVIEALAAPPGVREWFEPNYGSIRQATVCQDFSLRIKGFGEYRRLYAEETRVAPLMRGSRLGHDEAVACAGTPGKAANPPHRWDVRRGPKVLLVSSRFDPATPYSWAESLHRQAPGKTALLTYDGWGHVAYPRSECTRGGVDGYLIGLEVPGEGVRCAGVEGAALVGFGPLAG